MIERTDVLDLPPTPVPGREDAFADPGVYPGLPPGHVQPPGPKPRSRWRWVKRGFQAFVLLFVVLFAWLAITAPLSKSLQPMVPPSVTLLAADGQAIARNGAIIDRPVRLATLPKHVPQAFIAIEDRRFYSHWGVDPRGLARAAWNNLRGGGTQGGSTITQQFAKMTFLTADRNLSRKAREMLIAFWLEGWLTKDEILERYLSNAYFGDNVYGLRAASRHYFSRQPEQLTLAQAAMLAGLVKAPSQLAPSRNLGGAQARSLLVLAAMAETGAITPARAAATAPATLNLYNRSQLPTGTYFADWAMPQARAQSDDAYANATITTTLDARLQRLARAAIGRAALGKAQVALVAMRTNGDVVAMIGGRSYESSPFNRATQARRQPGSTFKLFVYLAALRSGMTPDSMIDDSPILDSSYRPKNSSEHYRGEITLRQAFARSSNVAAVRLYKQLGPEKVIEAARDLGIRSPLTADPTLALGSSGVSLLELTSAYAAVAAGRWPVSPHAVEPPEPGLLDRLLASRRTFGDTQHDQLLDLLRTVVTDGTGRRANLAINAYGKTGTSQDSRDALFVGFAGDLVVGVWVGNDDNTPLKGINGGTVPAQIWRDFMIGAVPGARPAAPVARPVDAPLDIPADLNIPLGNDTQLQIENGQSVTLHGEIGGTPLDLRLDKDGLTAGPRPPPPTPPSERPRP
jgi:penicillin-binding protein 1A